MNIEGLAVSALGADLARSDYLQKNINENDKIPSWDGEIYFKYYEPLDKRFTKDGLAKISVQVKGHVVDNFVDNNVVHYSIDIVDLKNYFYDGGAMFFVVYLDATEKIAKQIYYVSLLPKKILDILDRAGDQKSISVALRKLPKELRAMENTFRSFIREKVKQYILVQRKNLDVKKLIEQKKIKKFNFTLIGVKEDLSNIGDVFNSQDVYVYGSMEDDLAIEIPIMCIDTNSKCIIEASADAVISVNKEVYYENVVSIIEDGNKILKIGKSFKVYLEDNEIKCKFELNGNNRERLKDLRFFREIINAGAFYINGYKQKINDINCDIDVLDEDIRNYQELSDLLDILHIEKELIFDNFEKKDFNDLNLLVRGLGRKESLIGTIDTGAGLALYTAKVGNLKIIVLLKKEDDKNFKVLDIHEIDLVQCVSGDEKCEIPLMLTRTEEEFLEVNNFDFNNEIEKMDRVCYNRLVSEFSVNCLLNLLNAYDKTKRIELFETAKKLSEWLLNKENSDLNIINHFQLLKRERELRMDEKMILCGIYSRAKLEGNKLFMFACAVITDSHSEARQYYEELNEEQREFLAGRPIMHFFNG